MSTDNDSLEQGSLKDSPANDKKDVEPKASEARVERNRGTVDDILGPGLIEQARYCSDKLKGLIAGKVLISLHDSGKNFLVDWTQDQIVSSQVSGKADLATHGAECGIFLSEGDLKRIQRGDLNPQIAMLSDKIRVEGRKSSAIYLFNLIAPRAEVAR